MSEHILAPVCCVQARLAQSAERKALNLVVVGSSPTVGVLPSLGDVLQCAAHVSCDCVGSSQQLDAFFAMKYDAYVH